MCSGLRLESCVVQPKLLAHAVRRPRRVERKSRLLPTRRSRCVRGAGLARLRNATPRRAGRAVAVFARRKPAIRIFGFGRESMNIFAGMDRINP